MAEKQKYEDLLPEEQREAAIFTLAGLVQAETTEVPYVTDREKFLEFADKFYPQLRVLASDHQTNDTAFRLGGSLAFVTKSAEDRPEAVTLRLETVDTQLQFNLPNPDLLREDQRVWSPDSAPLGTAIMHLNGAIDEPLILDFGCRPNSDLTSLTNYADSIYKVSEFIVEASSPVDEQAA